MFLLLLIYLFLIIEISLNNKLCHLLIQNKQVNYHSNLLNNLSIRLDILTIIIYLLIHRHNHLIETINIQHNHNSHIHLIIINNNHIINSHLININNIHLMSITHIHNSKHIIHTIHNNPSSITYFISFSPQQQYNPDTAPPPPIPQSSPLLRHPLS